MSAGLTETQKLFQDRLLAGTSEIQEHLTDGGPFLKVYDHAYRARLLEVMGEDFPATHTLLGDDAFADATRHYIDAHPSRARSIRWLGRDFSAWLRATTPWQNQPVVADMAAFEWALGLAFDAPDTDALVTDDLARVPPEAWPILKFGFHPALNSLTLTFDVAPFQQAVANEQDPDAAPVALDAPQTWAAWRAPESLMVRYRALAEDEAAGLAVVMDGQPFSALCETMAVHGAADEAAIRAATCLRHWLEAGWLTDLTAEGLSWS